MKNIMSKVSLNVLSKKEEDVLFSLKDFFKRVVNKLTLKLLTFPGSYGLFYDK